MRIFMLAACVLVACAGASPAADLGHRMAEKPDAVASPSVPDPARQGGDTIADATLIPDIPYFDDGTTTGFSDDYDEICPYDGSTSPDVVYAYTPPVELVLTIDMDGSSYDTKIYVYDEWLNLVACNDDHYPDYVSLLENVPLIGGVTYFMVVDGYGGDHGDYVFNIVEYVPCVLECPPGGTLEGEPPLADGYLDAYNGGCNFPEFGNPFQDLHGDENGDLVFCGVAGWYDFEGQDLRDTDWFHLVVGPEGVIEATGDAEYRTNCIEVMPECNVITYWEIVEIGPCAANSMTISHPPGTVVWFWVGSSTFSPPFPGIGHEYDYVLWISGLMPQPVATEAASWTSVKSMFR